MKQHRTSILYRQDRLGTLYTPNIDWYINGTDRDIHYIWKYYTHAQQQQNPHFSILWDEIFLELDGVIQSIIHKEYVILSWVWFTFYLGWLITQVIATGMFTIWSLQSTKMRHLIIRKGYTIEIFFWNIWKLKHYCK